MPALASALSAAARADGTKSAQSAMHYQTTPNGGKQCSGCTFFLPAKDASANGNCQIVDGSISPTGYCIAFNAKSP